MGQIEGKAGRGPCAQTWGDKPRLFEAIAEDSGEQRLFTEAMHRLSIESGRAVAEALDFSDRHRSLNVGGGSGAYCIEAVRLDQHAKGLEGGCGGSGLVVVHHQLARDHRAARRQSLKALGEYLAILLLPPVDATGQSLRLDLLAGDGEGRGDVEDNGRQVQAPAEGRNYGGGEYEEWLVETGFIRLARVPMESPGANGLVVGCRP